MLIFLIMAIMGFFMVILGSSGILGVMGIMLSFIGGMVMLMPVMMMIGTIAKESLFPYFKKLKKDELLTDVMTMDGDTYTIIAKDRKEGVLYYMGKFLADKKGKTYRTPGGKRKTYVLAGIGMTRNPKVDSYFTHLKEDKNIPGYEEAIQKYLGPDRYKIFVQKFRTKQFLPDKFSIFSEIRWLLDIDSPADALKEHIVGETVCFKDALTYMVYAYDTNATENAIEREKLDIMMRQENYMKAKTQQAIGLAISFVIVIIGIGIALYMFQNVDFASFFGG